METKDTPHGVVGYRFARALLNGDYSRAHDLLSPELKLEYAEPRLRETFERMMSLANSQGELADIGVLDNGFLGDASLDAKGWAYLAIWTEAVTVKVKPFGPDYLITDLIWGRP